ncbi:MAG: glycosyltransferase [Prevotella sp.]|nr:glycosyltransferase [Prevotella sp.]
MMKIAIVLPCYNRLNTLIELCQSLRRADYLGDKVDLIFSIDYSGSQDVTEYAKSFEWPFGDKRIIAHPKNIGLKNNILSCGDLTSEYDAVIVLEDDLEVTPSFYRFAKQAAMFYDDCQAIGGISIYAYRMEEITHTEFHPYYEGYDCYLLQWASSWGQLWTRKQWKAFREWYSDDKDISHLHLPEALRRWVNSWKKYYIAYLVENDKYFVFPFFSHVYNGNKAPGEHYKERVGEVLTSSTLDFSKRDYHFIPYSEVIHKYDVFFQHKPIELNVNGQLLECEFDLFGHKCQVDSPYIITSKDCSKAKVIKSFDAGMLPLEENILTGKEGQILHLISKNDFQYTSIIPPSSYFAIRKRSLCVRDTFQICFIQFIQGVKRKILR